MYSLWCFCNESQHKATLRPALDVNLFRSNLAGGRLDKSGDQLHPIHTQPNASLDADRPGAVLYPGRGSHH